MSRFDSLVFLRRRRACGGSSKNFSLSKVSKQLQLLSWVAGLTLHTLHSTRYTPVSTPYILQSTLRIVHSTLLTLQSPLHTLRITFPAEYSTAFTVFTLRVPDPTPLYSPQPHTGTGKKKLRSGSLGSFGLDPHCKEVPSSACLG